MKNEKKEKLSKRQLTIRITCFVLAGLMALGAAATLIYLIAYNIAK